jgi:hypothetical protein
MTEIETEGPAMVPEGTRDPFLDLLLAHWPRIAAVAWDGWQLRGRGAVTIEDGSRPPVIDYLPGAPCNCHAEAVKVYDPEGQVVVAIIRPDNREVVWVETLGGWPTPPQAAALLPAAEMGAAVQ